jgi:RNA-binding protein
MKDNLRPSEPFKAHSFASELTSKQKAALKARAHHLKPLVQIGQNGLTDGIFKELLNALETHELIKLQLQGDTDAGEKKDALEEIAGQLPKNTFVVGRIGRTVILYLEKHPKEAKIPLKTLL